MLQSFHKQVLKDAPFPTNVKSETVARLLGARKKEARAEFGKILDELVKDEGFDRAGYRERPYNGDFLLFFLCDLLAHATQRRKEDEALSLFSIKCLKCILKSFRFERGLRVLFRILRSADTSLATRRQLTEALASTMNVQGGCEGPMQAFKMGSPLITKFPCNRDNFKRGYTWCCWIRLEALPEVKMNLVSFYHDNGLGVLSYVGAGGSIQVRAMSSQETHETQSMGNLSPLRKKRWYFVGMTHDVRGLATFYCYSQQLTVLGGKTTSSVELSYPKFPHPSRGKKIALNCTLGGFSGLMGTFRWFENVHPPENMYQLYLLGPGDHSLPLRNELCEKQLIFRSPPAGRITFGPFHDSGLYTAKRMTLSTVKAREIVSYNPSLTNACLTDGWELANTGSNTTNYHCDHSKNGKIVFAGSGLLQQYVHRMGGFRLLYHTFSPKWLGKKFEGEEGKLLAHQFLRLCTFALRSNESLQQDFHQLTATAFKNYFLDYFPPPLWTIDHLLSLQALFMEIVEYDTQLEDVEHFAAVVLLDFTYWSRAPAEIQLRLIRFVEAFLADESKARQFAQHPNLGIRRMLNSMCIVCQASMAPFINNSLKRFENNNSPFHPEASPVKSSPQKAAQPKPSSNVISENMSAVCSALANCIEKIARATKLQHPEVHGELEYILFLSSEAQKHASSKPLAVVLLQVLTKLQDLNGFNAPVEAAPLLLSATNPAFQGRNISTLGFLLGKCREDSVLDKKASTQATLLVFKIICNMIFQLCQHTNAQPEEVRRKKTEEYRTLISQLYTILSLHMYQMPLELYIQEVMVHTIASLRYTKSSVTKTDLGDSDPDIAARLRSYYHFVSQRLLINKLFVSMMFESGCEISSKESIASREGTEIALAAILGLLRSRNANLESFRSLPRWIELMIACYGSAEKSVIGKRVNQGNSLVLQILVAQLAYNMAQFQGAIEGLKVCLVHFTVLGKKKELTAAEVWRAQVALLFGVLTAHRRYLRDSSEFSFPDLSVDVNKMYFALMSSHSVPEPNKVKLNPSVIHQNFRELVCTIEWFLFTSEKGIASEKALLGHQLVTIDSPVHPPHAVAEAVVALDFGLSASPPALPSHFDSILEDSEATETNTTSVGDTASGPPKIMSEEFFEDRCAQGLLHSLMGTVFLGEDSVLKLDSSEDRLVIIRVLLHYLHRVIPHPASNFQNFHWDFVKHIRELLIDRLGESAQNHIGRRKAKNHKLIRLSFFVIFCAFHDFKQKGLRKHQKVYRTLLVDLYHYWGEIVFTTYDTQQILTVQEAGEHGRGILVQEEDQKKVFLLVKAKMQQNFIRMQYGVFRQEVATHIASNARIFTNLFNNKHLNSLDEKGESFLTRRRKKYKDLCSPFMSVNEAKQEAFRLFGEAFGRDDSGSLMLKLSKYEKKIRLGARARIKAFNYQTTVSRDPSLVPSLDCQLKSSNQQAPSGPLASPALKDMEFWKIDATEYGGSRMRQFLKKNYSYGSTHTSASNFSAKKKKIERAQVPLAQLNLPKQKEDVTGDDADEGEDELPAQEEKSDVASLREQDEEHDVEDFHKIEPQSQKKIFENERVMLVTPLVRYIGRFGVSRSLITYDGEEMVPEGHIYSAQPSDQEAPQVKHKKTKRLQWLPRHLENVYPRMHVLQHRAFELFFSSGRNYFFVILNPNEDLPAKQKELQNERNHAVEALCKITNLQSNQSSKVILNPSKFLRYSNLTKRWQNWEISNFEYLMQLNTIAGRTYNDLSQYPVFPWILTDYTSETLDLKNPRVYRDLSKPIGSLNRDRFETFKERYESFEEDEDSALKEPFMYGSHYSSEGIVLHYLMRLEPYTQLAINLQGGKFDHADRLFTSIPSAWNLSYSNVGDVKELIPEFFYLPEFLENINRVDFGSHQSSNAKVDDVQLPAWAKTPHDFVRINREALESDYVSDHLHEWIDLIFGNKQRGPAAVEAENVFFWLTYIGKVNLDEITDPHMRKATEDQIANFGVCPLQLFKTSHPKRRLRVDCRHSYSPISIPATLPNYKPDLLHLFSEPKNCGQYLKSAMAETECSPLPTMLHFCQGGLVVSINDVGVFTCHLLQDFLQRVDESHPVNRRSPLATADLVAPSEQKPDKPKTIKATAKSSSTSSLDFLNQKLKMQQQTDISNERANNPTAFESERLVSSIVSFQAKPLMMTCYHWFQTSQGLNRCVSAVVEGKSEAGHVPKLVFTGGYHDRSIKCHQLIAIPISATASNAKARMQMRCLPVASKTMHSGVITALAVSVEGSILFSGCSKGEVSIQKIGVPDPADDRTRRNSPFRSPLGFFSLHEGKVIDVSCNLGQSVFVSLAKDPTGTRGCQLAIYSFKQQAWRPDIRCVRLVNFGEGPSKADGMGGLFGSTSSSSPKAQQDMAQDISSEPHVAPFWCDYTVEGVDMQRAVVTATGNIVLYGIERQVPTLFLLNKNGSFVTKIDTNEILSSLLCTQAMPNQSLNAHHGFVITGGTNNEIYFRSEETLEIVQFFNCDGRVHGSGQKKRAQSDMKRFSGQPPPIKQGVVSLALSGNGDQLVAVVQRDEEGGAKLLYFPLPRHHTISRSEYVANYLAFSLGDIKRNVTYTLGENSRALGAAVYSRVGDLSNEYGISSIPEKVGNAAKKKLGMFASISGKFFKRSSSSKENFK